MNKLQNCDWEKDGGMMRHEMKRGNQNQVHLPMNLMLNIIEVLNLLVNGVRGNEN
jgi:hypothetical protein